jgi:hypothetical protein
MRDVHGDGMSSHCRGERAQFAGWGVAGRRQAEPWWTPSLCPYRIVEICWYPETRYPYYSKKVRCLRGYL